MQPIDVQIIMKHTAAFLGRTVYIHLEVNPGGYWRNGSALLKAFHVKGQGPYRAFMELDDGGALIQLNDLTDMHLTEDTVILTGYDDRGRIAGTLEVSLTPFSM